MKAREAEFAEAMELCTQVLVESIGAEGFEILRAYGEGLAAGAELKRLIIEGAERAKATVFIDHGDGPVRARLLSADRAVLRFEAGGNVLSLRWGLVAPLRFYGIASKTVPETPRSHLLLARYSAAMGFPGEAREQLGRAAADPGLAEEIRSVQALVE